MTHHTYDTLRAQHPELFANHTGGIEIIHTSEPGYGIVYQDEFITLIRDHVQFPDGTIGSYNRIFPTDMVPGCAMMPILDGRIVLIEHYRHATRSWHLEIPRGCGEPMMSPEDTAMRELAEEIDATARELIPLGDYHPDTGTLGHATALYAALIDGIGQLDRHEGIRRARVLSLEETESLVVSGELTDGFTLAALYRARLVGVLPACGRNDLVGA
jgi:ADP-ribose pyrophosphatase